MDYNEDEKEGLSWGFRFLVLMSVSGLVFGVLSLIVVWRMYSNSEEMDIVGELKSITI